MQTTQITKEQLKAYIERVEKLSEEKDTIATDIREVYAEARGNGYDVKAMRQIVKLRKLDAAEREEQEQLIDLYSAALGMKPEMGE